MHPEEIHLTVAIVSYRTRGKIFVQDENFLKLLKLAEKLKPEALINNCKGFGK